jgi:hypothetical protein
MLDHCISLVDIRFPQPIIIPTPSLFLVCTWSSFRSSALNRDILVARKEGETQILLFAFVRLFVVVDIGTSMFRPILQIEVHQGRAQIGQLGIRQKLFHLL